MKPSLLKKILASSKCVFPGMIPQKQGTAQFIGSFNSGCIVSLAWAGSNVSSGVSVMVGEGVLDGRVTIPVGVGDSVALMTGIRVDVGIVGAVAEGIVGPAGEHAAKAKAKNKQRDNKDNGFIIETFPIVPHF